MSILPLPVIVAQLTKINGCTEELAKAFLVEFADLIGAELAECGFAEVKGIGTFQRIDVGEAPTVEFCPDPSLAEAVNLPFTMFEPVELDDDVTSEMLDAVAEEAEAETSVMPQKMDIHLSGMVVDANEMPDEEATRLVDKEDVTEKNPDTSVVQKENVQQKPQEQQENAQDERKPDEGGPNVGTRCRQPSINEKMAERRREAPNVTYERIIEKERVVENSSRHTMNIVLTAFLSLLAGLLIGFFAYDKLNLHGVKSVNISADDVQVYHAVKDVVEIEAVEADSLPVAVAPVSTPEIPVTENHADSGDGINGAKTGAVVTDTVRSGRFLTTMAQRHYGKKKFWVYIYLENSDKLGDPDLIPPMTVVTVPPAEKYGIQPGNKASEQDAERKAVEIMSRYSKN